MVLPNDLRISCRPSSYRPHKSTVPLTGLEEGCARAEPRPASACRLHARVRPQPEQIRGMSAYGVRGSCVASLGSEPKRRTCPSGSMTCIS